MPVKPSQKEEEYFARHGTERRRKAQGTCRKKRLREFHYMRCPKCGMELTEPIMLRKHIVAGLLALTLVL
jgi:hypothetical protein